MNRKIVNVEEIYHDEHASWYFERNKKDYIWHVPEDIALLTSNYIPQSGYIIDMGCGPAVSPSRYFSHRDHSQVNYIGVDISNEMLTIAKKNIPWGDFLRGDISTIALNKKNITCILSLGALHHTQDHQKTLLHWLKMLSPGGRILLREPTLYALPPGAGESPIEKGINLNLFIKFINDNNAKIILYRLFSSHLFHLCNRFLIKMHLGWWSKIRLLWYPVTYVDFFVSQFQQINIFKSGAFLMVIEKL